MPSIAAGDLRLRVNTIIGGKFQPRGTVLDESLIPERLRTPDYIDRPDRHICASIIAVRDDWKELLSSIPAGPSRRNVAVVVAAIREALGLEADHAIEICQGVE